jgi:cytochrome c oxidase assembly protein subunit 11
MTQDFNAIAARNQRTGLIVMGLVIAMIALSFASVPLYRLFCQVTGFGGASVRAVPAQNPGQIIDRPIEVRFNTDVDSSLDWGFTPTDLKMTVNIGQDGLTAFRAVNRGGAPITGTAVFNVLPEKAAKYFHKTQCFCFGEQTLAPGEQVNMPVLFYIDPAFANDPNMDGVDSLVLSYTFYKTGTKALDQAIEAFQSP